MKNSQKMCLKININIKKKQNSLTRRNDLSYNPKREREKERFLHHLKSSPQNDDLITMAGY